MSRIGGRGRLLAPTYNYISEGRANSCWEHLSSPTEQRLGLPSYPRPIALFIKGIITPLLMRGTVYQAWWWKV